MKRTIFIMMILLLLLPVAIAFAGGEKEPKDVPAERAKLSILQWSHFVPQYDRWFDPFAKAWGDVNGVDVTVDHINLAELGNERSQAREFDVAPAELGAAQQRHELAGDAGPTAVNWYLPPITTASRAGIRTALRIVCDDDRRPLEASPCLTSAPSASPRVSRHRSPAANGSYAPSRQLARRLLTSRRFASSRSPLAPKTYYRREAAPDRAYFKPPVRGPRFPARQARANETRSTYGWRGTASLPKSSVGRNTIKPRFCLGPNQGSVERSGVRETSTI